MALTYPIETSSHETHNLNCPHSSVIDASYFYVCMYIKLYFQARSPYIQEIYHHQPFANLSLCIAKKRCFWRLCSSGNSQVCNNNHLNTFASSHKHVLPLIKHFLRPVTPVLYDNNHQHDYVLVLSLRRRRQNIIYQHNMLLKLVFNNAWRCSPSM